MRSPRWHADRRDASARTGGNGHLPRRRPLLPAALVLVAAVAVAAGGAFVAADRSHAPQTVDSRVQQIGSGLGCVTCQNLSVADSPAGTARAMRAEIRRRLLAGETPAQIKAFFVAKYGESILLSPRSALPWVVPVVALAGGVALLGWMLWRRRPAVPEADPHVSPAERARIRRELAALEEPD